MKRLFLIGIILAAALAEAAQRPIYLLTGFSTPKGNDAYDPTLLRVAADGTLTEIADLMPDHGGTDAILISNDLRKAVFVPKQLPMRQGRKLVVVDFDHPSVIKQCEIPAVPGAEYLITQWLVNVPVKGSSFQQHLAGEGLHKEVIQSMLLDPSVPCTRSFENGDPGDIVHMIASGGGFSGSIDENGQIRLPSVGAIWHALPYQIPYEMRKGSEPRAIAGVVVNNSALLLVSLQVGQASRQFVLRKRDRSWHTFPSLGDPAVNGAFGNFVAFIESKPKDAHNKETVGRVEWRKKPSRTGPSMEELFDDYDRVRTGRLHLYDSDSERVYTIETKQGDSEIVLVEDNVVYYRVSDRLYSAPIRNKGVGAARLLAKAEQIRDAHWAFIKH